MSEKSIDGRPLRILFAGGGTGGHLFPAIAIAESVRVLEPRAEIVFVGTKDKIEARVVPAHGFGFRTIWISGFHRGLKLRNVLFPAKVIVSSMQARALLKEFKPDVVVGTGGYVAGPVLRSAVQRKIPTIIQEQNSYPGVTTRLLSKKVDEVHITFEQSRQYLSGAKQIFLTGNPTRGSLEKVERADALRYFGFDEQAHEKTVLILGGSLGAHSINEAVAGLIGEIASLNVRLIWQTGAADAVTAENCVASFPKKRAWVGAFIEKMDYAYAAADIVVSRAGATTIAELTRLGKPAIFIPYPHAAANHQFENARALAECGAAKIIGDAEIRENLIAELRTALDASVLHRMSGNAKLLGKPEAARILAEHAVALAKRTRERSVEAV